MINDILKNMTKEEKLKLINELLDIVEFELNNIAISVGHPLFSEWKLHQN